jgi:hypothetical protein
LPGFSCDKHPVGLQNYIIFSYKLTICLIQENQIDFSQLNKVTNDDYPELLQTINFLLIYHYLLH